MFKLCSKARSLEIDHAEHENELYFGIRVQLTHVLQH
jgi:hypothetical protein